MKLAIGKLRGLNRFMNRPLRLCDSALKKTNEQKSARRALSAIHHYIVLAPLLLLYHHIHNIRHQEFLIRFDAHWFEILLIVRMLLGLEFGLNADL